MATPTPSYAVVWRKDGGPIVPGQLRLEPEGVRLIGAAQGRPEEHLLAYGALAHVRLGHHAAERIQGRPSLFLEVGSPELFVIAAIGGVGVVTELADRLVAAMTLA